MRNMGKRIITMILVACTMLFSFSSCYTHGPRHGRGPRHGHAKVHKGKHHGARYHKKGKGKKWRAPGGNERLAPRRR